MTSKNHDAGSRKKNVAQESTEKEEIVYLEPSKSQVKRDCQHLVDIGEEILKLKSDELESLELPEELENCYHHCFKNKIS